MMIKSQLTKLESHFTFIVLHYTSAIMIMVTVKQEKVKNIF